MLERLTEKHIVDNIDCGYKIKKDTCKDGIIQGWNKIDAINKLGKLEDVEELCKKIVKKPVYEKVRGNIIKTDYTKFSASYNFKTNAIYLLDGIEVAWVLDVDCYGKTWATTKEELL